MPQPPQTSSTGLPPPGDHKKKNKSARFGEEVSATVIPPSKNYQNDHDKWEETNKEAVQEFRSKRTTFILAIVIGLVFFIAGCLLLWHGVSRNLRDFYIVGPGVLVIGLIICLVGLILLVRMYFMAKNANLKVKDSGEYNKRQSTPSFQRLNEDYDALTSSSVSIHGVNSRASSAKESNKNNSANNTHSSSEHSNTSTAISPVPSIIARVAKETVIASEIQHVEDFRGQSYCVSIPNEAMYDGISIDDIPDPAKYNEPYYHSLNPFDIPAPAEYTDPSSARSQVKFF